MVDIESLADKVKSLVPWYERGKENLSVYRGNRYRVIKNHSIVSFFNFANVHFRDLKFRTPKKDVRRVETRIKEDSVSSNVKSAWNNDIICQSTRKVADVILVILKFNVVLDKLFMVLSKKYFEGPYSRFFFLNFLLAWLCARGDW